MGRALVTSARTRVAYNICKSLARRGVEVVVADARPHAMSFASRHAAGTARYTSPFEDEAAFVDDLLRIIDRERIDVLVPVLEETYMVARHHARFAPHVGLCLAGYHDMVRLHDKASLRGLAADCGVPMPQTVSLAALLASPGIADGLAYPQLVKPRQGGGGWAVEEAATPARLLDIARQRGADGGLAQQKLAGHMVCVAMLYDAGRLVASDTYRVLETYPHPYGQGTLRDSVACPGAEAGLRALLDALHWTGVCEADFIVVPDGTGGAEGGAHGEDGRGKDAGRGLADHVAQPGHSARADQTVEGGQARQEAQTGQSSGASAHLPRLDGAAYLIDVNPRFWGSLAHSVARGVDFPHYYYLLAMGERDVAVPQAPPGVVTRWLGGDIMRVGAQFIAARDRLGYISGALRQRRRVAAYDDFDLADPLPMLAWSAGQAVRAVRKALGMTTTSEALSGVWE